VTEPYDIDRALRLRKQINELKTELRELETGESKMTSEFSVTGTACGHDEILAALRKSARAMRSDTNATIAGYSDGEHMEEKWFYSSTLPPEDFSYYVDSPSRVRAFYSHLFLGRGFDYLYSLWPGSVKTVELIEIDPADIQWVIEAGLVRIEPSPKLTLQGTKLLLVLGHLYYWIVEKPDPEKALKILPEICEVFRIDFMGGYLSLETADAMELLREKGVLDSVVRDKEDEEIVPALIKDLRSPTRQRMARRITADG
jgi:hypothetical protein